MRTPILSTILIFVSGIAAAELLAGTARADITPPVGGSMYGYGARGSNVSTGVHDPLFAKALVLRNGNESVAIVTLDWGSVTQETSENVRAMTRDGAGIENVLLVASHTHSAPAIDREFPSKDQPYIVEAERAIADAVIAAANDVKPSRIRAGWGHVEEGHNRRRILPDGTVEMLWTNRERVPTSPVDYALGVIQVETESGETVATLVNYQTHPVVLGPENLLISADYPGALTRMVEESLGGQCMFLQGAAGDINPFWDKTPPDEGGFEQAQIMGQAIAREVLDIVPDAQPIVGDPAISFHTEIVGLASRRDRKREDVGFYAEVNTLLIGNDIAIATFPGEFFVEHGLRLKEASPIPNTFFVGYTNRRLRYFPTIRAAAEGGYGAASATIVEVGAGERLVNRALINLYYQAGLLDR